MSDFDNPENGELVVYVDTVNGTHGTEVGIDGKIENPCRTFEDAKKLMENLEVIAPDRNVLIKDLTTPAATKG